MTSSKTGIAVVAALWTLMTGCADATGLDYDPEAEGADTASETLAQTGRPTRPGTSTSPSAAPSSNSRGSRISVPDPNGVYVADVTAEGTGCAPGTWRASLASDGKAFTITFSDYQVSLSEDDERDRKSLNCAIKIAMNSPKGLSYAVSHFSYQGYAYLEEGVQGTLNTFYDFEGQAIAVGGAPRGARTDSFKGVRDDDFLFVHDVATRDQVFSACGTQRNLMIQTSLQMVNSRPKRSGYLNLSAIDGRTSSITLRLATRPCATR